MSHRDVFDTVVSGALMFVTIVNPLGWQDLSAYSILDAMSAFGELKHSLGFDDRIILKS